MTTKQPEALRLADELERVLPYFPEPTALELDAAAELRRLHEVNAELLEALQRVCSHGTRTSQQIDADWGFARAAIAKAGGAA